MDDKRIDLMKNQPIPKAINTLAIPAILGLIIMAVYNMVDAMFVSWLGTSAAGAIQVVFPAMMLMVAVAMLFAMGGASYISRLLGANNKERANQVCTTCILSILGLAVGVTAVGFIFMDPILKFFGASEAILPSAREYFMYIIAGAIFHMGNVGFNNMLRGEGSAAYSMIGMGTGALLNIALDPLFIFGFKMGVKGAALATSLSAMTTFIILLSHYLRRRSVLHIRFKSYSLDRTMMFEVFKVGAPTMIRQILASVAVGILNQKAILYGGDPAMVGIGLMSRVFMIVTYIIFGFGQGFQPVVGYNYGAKHYKRMKESIRYSNLVTTVIMVVAAIIFVFFPRQIMMIFKAEPEVVDVAVQAFRYFAITMPFIGYAITINVLFQAMGRAIPAALLSLSRQGIFFFPIIFIFPKAFGLTGVLLTQPMADVLTVILTTFLGIKVCHEINQKAKAMDEPDAHPQAAR